MTRHNTCAAPQTRTIMTVGQPKHGLYVYLVWNMTNKAIIYFTIVVNVLFLYAVNSYLTEETLVKMLLTRRDIQYIRQAATLRGDQSIARVLREVQYNELNRSVYSWKPP